MTYLHALLPSAPADAAPLHYLTLDDVVAIGVDDVTPLNLYADGYGPAVPTRYQLLLVLPGSRTARWHRLYCMNYGNSGSLYVRGTVDGERAPVLHLDAYVEWFVERVRDAHAAGGPARSRGLKAFRTTVRRSPGEWTNAGVVTRASLAYVATEDFGGSLYEYPTRIDGDGRPRPVEGNDPVSRGRARSAMIADRERERLTRYHEMSGVDLDALTLRAGN